jgi:maltose O-acetyltransferase
MPKITGSGAISSRLRIGTHCGFNDGCEFDLQAPITIGDHVSIGHEVRFLTSLRPDGASQAAPIRVGGGVWIAARCVVAGGVSIGDGAVIGAGTTVVGDVPSNTLVTGGKMIPLPTWR